MFTSGGRLPGLSGVIDQLAILEYNGDGAFGRALELGHDYDLITIRQIAGPNLGAGITHFMHAHGTRTTTQWRSSRGPNDILHSASDTRTWAGKRAAPFETQIALGYAGDAETANYGVARFAILAFSFSHIHG